MTEQLLLSLFKSPNSFSRRYSPVKIKLNTRNVGALVNSDGAVTTGTGAPTVNLWADYIYLDTDERRRFAQVSHEYLIEQVQSESTAVGNAVAKNSTLNFNHPVKELMWVIQDTSVTTEQTAGTMDATANLDGINSLNGNDYFCYFAGTTDGATEIINGQSSVEAFGTAKLVLNGSDRFAPRNATYFRTCQPIQAGHRVPSKHMYVYSFALKPEEHQPSGTCNFSRIDNAQLEFGGLVATGTLTVFAINYNVLRIMSGMGGLAYSN